MAIILVEIIVVVITIVLIVLYSVCTNFLNQEVMTPTPLDLEVMGLKPGSHAARTGACLHLLSETGTEDLIRNLEVLLPV